MDLFDKEFFPTLKNNPSLAYFDNAATTQTHQWVLDSMSRYYEYERCNIHRSDFAMSDHVAEQVYNARRSVANLLNAEPEQIMFTAGATDSLNIIADWYSGAKQVIISQGEHNANIVPWVVRNKTPGNGLNVLELHKDFGTININDAVRQFEKCPPGSLLSIATVHNSTGAMQWWEALVREAKAHGLVTCLDACQSIMHSEINVQETPVDYIVFSGHKMFGPTGIGVLYSRQGFENLRPVRFGGGGVEHVTFSDVVFYNDVARHEVGTQNISGILGIGTAAEFINYVGYDHIKSRIDETYKLFEVYRIDELLAELKFERVYIKDDGFARHSKSILSYRNAHMNPSDLTAMLGNRNVASRSGKMCAHPIVNSLSKNGLFRLSTAPYNTIEDVIKLSSELTEVLKKFS